MIKDLSISSIRKDFPFFEANPSLIYLDSSATSQRLKSSVDAVSDFYLKKNASPFRGLYDLSQEATDTYEEARSAVASFIHAKEAAEIIFTRNASESLNLLSYSLASTVVRKGDDIIVGITEHHSNMLPWRDAAKRLGANVIYWECTPEGEFTPESLEKLLTNRTKIVAITQVSNVFGRVNDIKTFASICHRHGALIVCDGAQSVPHMPVDVQNLDVDFLAFSGHKMLAPMGIGVLYGKREWLEAMPPFLSGGEMIDYVTLDRIVYSPLPHKFEAGTVNVGGAIGLQKAIEYIRSVGFDFITKREHDLSVRLCKGILEIPHFTVIGSQDPEEHHGIVTFKIDGVHPHDISAILAEKNIAVRAGHHCAQPLHIFLKVPSTTRASLMFYNTEEEVDALIDALKTVRGVMGYAE